MSRDDSSLDLVATVIGSMSETGEDANDQLRGKGFEVFTPVVMVTSVF
jgi:hypothetical protein